MAKPTMTSLNDMMRLYKETFVSWELWLSDELSGYLATKRNLDPDYISIVVDIDYDNPIHKVVDNTISIRLNGRFYTPKEDKDGTSIKDGLADWVKIFQDWFSEQGVEAEVQDDKELIRFTAFIPTIELPEIESVETEETTEPVPGSEEEMPEGAGEESSDEGGDEEPPAEQPDSPEEETEPEKPGPEKPEEPEEEAEDPELIEFEKALGI